MKRIVAAALLAVLALPGCRSFAQQEMLERELREQEDKYLEKQYELEDELSATKRKLAAAEREVELLRSRLSNATSGSTRSSPARGLFQRSAPDDAPKPKADEYKPPQIRIEGVPGADQGTFQFPEISPPDPSRPEGVLPRLEADERLPAQEVKLAPPEFGAPTLELPTPGGGKASSAEVAEVTLDAKLTGGLNLDTHPGDEGLLVVVEPRDGAGQVVSAPAKVSIVVMDPAIVGEEGRLARWDYTPEQAGANIRAADEGGGLLFEVAWPDGPPMHRALVLYVRYTTADGRRFNIERPIQVELIPKNAPVARPAERPQRAMPSVSPRPAPQGGPVRQWSPSTKPTSRRPVAPR